eukprot:5946430-Amphidinium_carterae.1
MRHRRQLGLIIQSVLGHNRTVDSDIQWHLNDISATKESRIPQLVRTEQFDGSSQYVLGRRWHNQAAICHGGQWRGAQPPSGNGATPLAQRQSHGLAADGTSRQQCGQWHRLAVEKPSDNHALFGDNDSGERWEVAHNFLYNDYIDFENDFVLTSLHNAALPNLSNERLRR